MENDTAAKKTEERPHRSGPVLTMARSRRKETIFVWAMLALPIVHFCIFYVWLNFNSTLMSFQEGYEMEWVDGFPFLTGNIRYGFQNFLSIFQDKDGILTKILPNTLKYFEVNLLLMLPLSLIVSYFLYKKVPGNVFFRYVFFLPVIVSGIGQKCSPELFQIGNAVDGSGFLPCRVQRRQQQGGKYRDD